METTDLQPRPTAPVESRWRRITTPIPVPESVPLIERLRAAEPVSMSGLPPILWDQAEGFLVRDPFGNQWIDLTSGIVMANAGHSHPRVVEAIHRAADRHLLATYVFPSRARLDLLEKLVSLAPFADAKAILYSGGSEANECAVMLMRRHGQSLSPHKVGILSFAGGFHGRTLGANLASGRAGPGDWLAREQARYYQVPFPFCPRCPHGRENYQDCGEWCFAQCLAQLEQAGIGPEHIAGVIGEPITGATWPLATGFARCLRDWATEHQILVCFDEVQAGCGRTGRFYASEHLGIVPDLVVLAKGLTSSLPVSAVIGPRWLLDIPDPGEMSSTHGGSPVCAAAALANLQVIEDEDLVRSSARTGKMALSELRGLQREFPDRVLSVHGRGLFLSAHLKVPDSKEPDSKEPDSKEPDIALADAIALEAVRRGVMMFTTGAGFLKVAPPLGIAPEALREALTVVRECMRDLVG